MCRAGRRREAAEESGTDIKPHSEVGNQPTCVYDCYSTATSHRLPVPAYRKHNDVVVGVTGSDVIKRGATTRRMSSAGGVTSYTSTIRVTQECQYDVVIGNTGSDVIDGDATTTTPGCHVTSLHRIDKNKMCRMHEIGLPASRIIYQTYVGSVTS